MQNTKLGT